MDGNELYEIISSFMPGAFWLKKSTPDWSDDDRVTTLWMWAMENQHKYDPEKGTLEQWLKGCSKRIIDVYRKEHGGRRVFEMQFPQVEYEKKKVCASTLLEAPEEREGPDEDTLERLDRAMQLLSDDSRMILEAIARNHVVCDDGLAEQLGIKKSTLQSRRTLAKNRVRKEMEQYGHGR